MPPSAKRSSQRTRKVRDPSPSPAHQEQLSPSRPNKRRRKTQPDPSSEAVEAGEQEGSSTMEPTAGNDAIDDDALVARVAQHLTTIPIKAIDEYSNDRQVETDPEGIQAYAKITGKEWTYFIRNLRINIGRSSEPSHGHPTPTETEHKGFVHIDLGPQKVFSRQTAMIYFDDDWFLQVKGRNGLKVNGSTLKKDDAPHKLSSGEVIEVGGVEMMFVLPKNLLGGLNIHEMYLERAGIAAPVKTQKSSPTPEPARRALPEAPSSASQQKSIFRAADARGLAPQPIAPAPPDYKRPGTPPSAKGRTVVLQHKSPAYGRAGTMLMGPNDVDLSLEENKHVKPLFSYAQMITQAILSTEDHKLHLNRIYAFITDRYAYYRNQQPAGWQNSIRHNLSLNQSFIKSPRTTEEPGKGMKWEIKADKKEEMVRNAYKLGRGGHRGSSNPSSPSQPNQLSYINQGPKDMLHRGPASTRKRKASPANAASPPPSSSLNPSRMTPDRKYVPSMASIQDGSPLPRSRKPQAPNAASSFGPARDSAPRSPPTLSSSYFQDEGNSFVTPAPLRVHPLIVPPSTAQRPSQHMPTSSPAAFWKYAEIGSTPLKNVPFDISPSKPALPNSSSPPPPINGTGSGQQSPVTSPSRSTGRAATQETNTVVEEEEAMEEEPGIDLTKGFQTIGSYHAAPTRFAPKANASRICK